MPQSPITIHHHGETIRLDRLLKNHHPMWGRKAIDHLIRDKQVTVNGRTIRRNSWKVNMGDTVVIKRIPDEVQTIVRQFDESWLIHHDQHLIVVDKPSGLLSQGTNPDDTNNLLYLATQRFGKVTLFHRLDRETSGVLLLTRTKAINRHLDTCFKERAVRKQYIAVVHRPNDLAPHGDIKMRLAPHPTRWARMQVVERGGKFAHTEYNIIAEHEQYQRVRVQLHTGRMHQIRVHLRYRNAPIVGDTLYGVADDAPRSMLHAHQITIPPMADDNQPRIYTTPIPNVFDEQFQ